MNRWPLVWKSSLEREREKSAGLERRLFFLRDNIKSGIWRIKMNLSLSENANAERVLTMALVEDLERDKQP